MSLSLYGYVDMGGCVCIVVFYCQMVLVGWLEFKSLRHLVISAPSQIGTQVSHFGPKLNGTWSNRHLTIVNSEPFDSQFGTYVYIFFHLYIGKL